MSVFCSNEEGEEHLRQRKLQLPFNCTTGEGVLYETGPTLDSITEIQNQSKGQKMQRPPSLDPDSLLGSMLQQDHSVYNQNNDPNSQFTLDKAFMDSHALLNVPGNTWQPSAPNAAAEIKEEGVVKDMMETLQQIIGDSTLCESLQDFDMDKLELKEWENTLLRMQYNNNMDLNKIITNDILSYVEDALFKENGVQLPEQLKDPFVELPECLPEMELQNNVAANQAFNCQAEILGESPGQGGFIRMNIQDGVDPSSPGRGMEKLTHMGPQILPGDTFVQSFGIDQTAQNMPSNNIMFNPSLAMQSNQARLGLQGPVQENGMVPCGPRNLQTGNHPHPNAMTLPLQSPLLQGTSTVPMGFHNQNSLPQQPSVSQNPQWISDSNNMVDNLLNSCGRNVSGSQDAGLHSGPNTQLQGQFSLHTQNPANPGLPTWQPSQPTPQQVPKSFSSGPQNMTGFIGQVKDFQRDPLGQLLSHTNAQGFGSGLLPQTTANSVYPQETTNSCMFTNTPQPLVNGMQYGSADPVSSMSSCQRAKGLITQSPTQASCYYQRGLEVDMTVIPQENTNISPMACQVPLGLTPDNMLAQQYLSCNGQTQVNCTN